MSKIIKHSGEDVPLSHFVQTSDRKYWYVDSRYTEGRSYETMVFAANKKLEVTNWASRYTKRYPSESEMEREHNEVINNLEEYIDKGEFLVC